MVIMNITVIFLLGAVASMCLWEARESSQYKAYACTVRWVGILSGLGGILFAMYTFKCYTGGLC